MLHLIFIMAAGIAPKSLRDASLEKRCEALAAYVREHARSQLKEAAYRSSSCSEGNGLGGARYALDFKLGNGEDSPRSFRLEIAYKDGGASEVRLCDITEASHLCSDGKQGELAKVLGELHPKAEGLLPAVAAWATAKQTEHTVYGIDYKEFVKGMLAWQDGFPLKGKVQTVRIRLEPEVGDDPTRGKARFEGDVDADFLRCFDCADLKCLNDGVRYRFEDRFFTLSREAAPASGRALGASWIIEGPKPLAASVAAWRFICGASRYSLSYLGP
jgi:hypothetical protein